MDTASQTTFLNNMFRHLNDNKNPMDQAAAVQAVGGFFGQSKTRTIEERAFDYRAPGGQEYQFFLVVRRRLSACFVVVLRNNCTRHKIDIVLPKFKCDGFNRRHQ